MTPTRFRWFIVFLLFAITIVNYIDRAAISYAIPLIQRELGFSPAESGAILGAFGLGYAITTLLGGFAVDRWGARIVLTVAAVLWSLSIGMTSLATGVAMLYAARVLLGVSEGPNFPALTGAVTHWLSPHERATALANALLAVPLALAVGGPIVTHLLTWLDWRLTFGVLFVLSAAWVPLWYFLFRDSPSESRFVNRAELDHIQHHHDAVAKAPARRPEDPGPGMDVIAALLSNRTLLANTWAFFVFGYFLFFFMTWLPSYLERKYGLHLDAVGLFTVLPWLAAAVMLWLFGRWSDHLLATTGRLRIARSYLIAGTQFVAAIAIVPVAMTDNLTVAIAGITVAVAASMGANAAYYAVNVDIVPERAATALGIMDFAFAIAGFLAPAITGWVLNIRGSFTDGFLLMAVLALSSVVVVLPSTIPTTTPPAHMTEIKDGTTIGAAFAATVATPQRQAFFRRAGSRGTRLSGSRLRDFLRRGGRQVEALAAIYRAAGYGLGHRVATLLENRPDYVLHKLALNSIGVCCVPDKPRLSDGRDRLSPGAQRAGAGDRAWPRADNI